MSKYKHKATSEKGTGTELNDLEELKLSYRELIITR